MSGQYLYILPHAPSAHELTLTFQGRRQIRCLFIACKMLFPGFRGIICKAIQTPTLSLFAAVCAHNSRAILFTFYTPSMSARTLRMVMS